VLEYVDGHAVEGPLPVDEAVHLALQIVGAVEEAHSHGILHRDLKPANILVTDDGTVKLLDFGLAKLTDTDAEATRTAVGTVVGTAAYMAPEQVHGRAVDVRSDTFSFGAVVYEMIAGCRAFAGKSLGDVFSAILHDDPPPLDVSPAIGAIVRRCLEKEPERRFQSMTDVRYALESAVGESSLSAAAQRRLPCCRSRI